MRKRKMKKTSVVSSKKKYFIPGSSIPIAYLLDYFKEGLSISDFVSAYPWISREKVKKVLEEMKRKEFTMRNAL